MSRCRSNFAAPDVAPDPGGVGAATEWILREWLGKSANQSVGPLCQARRSALVRLSDRARRGARSDRFVADVGPGSTRMGWVPVTTSSRWRVARPRSARRGRGGPGGDGHEPVVVRTTPQQCLAYVHPLWLFAWFTCGDPVLAEEVTVDAVVEACADPATPAGGSIPVWAALVGHVERICDELVGSVPASAAPSMEQREAVALVLAGRTPPEVASLLQVPPMQVHRALNGGLQGLRRYLLSARHAGDSASAHPAPAPRCVDTGRGSG